MVVTAEQRQIGAPSSPAGFDAAAAAVAAVPDARLPAWLASAIIHGGLFMLFAIAWRHIAPKRIEQGEPDRKAGIAVVEVQGEERRYWHATAASTPTDQATSTQTVTAESALIEANSSLVSLPDAGQIGPGPTGGTGLPGATSLTGLGQPARGLGGQGQTSVFGAEGRGSKFVYVFDRSGSMNGFNGRPLAAAKQQLLESLAKLEHNHQFQIIFYNERAEVFNPLSPQPPRLLFADEQGKRLAERFVQGISATGGSHHYDALRLAMQMQPDVVFLLTDGQENTPTAKQLEGILRQASRAGTTIHCIEFGVGPPVARAPFLRYLASQTGGQYVYVDVTKLAK